MSSRRTVAGDLKALGIDPAGVRVGPVPPGDLAAPLVTSNKYHAVKTVYNGRCYDSKREAARAAELDTLQAGGRIAWWEPQPKVRLGPAAVEYRPDFLVIAHDRFWFEDIKGKEVQRTRDIARLWHVHGPAPLEILYRDHTVTIVPGAGGPVRYPDDDSTGGED